MLTQESNSALAGVAQWTAHRTLNQKVAGLVPSQGACLGCVWARSPVARERQPHIKVSLPLFLLPFP